MKLASLLGSLINKPIEDCEIFGIQNDSRQVKPGYLFLAYPGAIADGRNYIKQAIDLGARAIVYEDGELPFSGDYLTKVPLIPITNLNKLLSIIAARFYSNPTKSLSITGVTGTNGKTTIAYQLARAHELLGVSSAYIGTLGHGSVSDLRTLENTTPDALCLQKLFYDYKQNGVNEVCMEVSSHALSQGRADSINFSQAIYTNLSHEHLDYHHTMQSYAEAKALLFKVPSLEAAILNKDDAFVNIMSAALPKNCKKLTYGMHENADIQALNCQYSLTGSEFEVKSDFGLQPIKIKSIGAFNIYNSLAVYSSLLMHGYSNSDIRPIMEQLQPSVGRMEIVADEPCVIIDFAHTPEALKSVLLTLVQLRECSDLDRKIWIIFGCGGDRDTLKRPIMGKIASEYADYVVLTSDNPRREDPEQIITEISNGLIPTAKALRIVDRKKAISKVLQMANPQDIILISGKGHETYQQIGDKKIIFSDKHLVQDILNIFNY